MKKFFLLLIAVIFLLVSCSTFGSGTENGEEKTAVETLVSDCLLALPSDPVTADDLEPVLPESYTSYETYLPSYSAIRLRYLNAVCAVVNSAFSESFFSDEVTQAGETLSDEPSSYISGEAVIPDIESITRESLSVLLVEYLSQHSEDLEAAFSESRTSFSMVKRSYSSLSIIGEEIILPDAEMLSVSDMSEIALDRFYSLLSSAEIELRNNPLYGDSVYRLFWSST